jgi:hypothetical protein
MTQNRGTFCRLAIPGALLLSSAYLFFLRPWHLRWGATKDEAHRLLPGDNEISKPMVQATRAITIEAPPDKVWPWLVQIGYKRGGFYSYDRLDNAGIPSADAVLPQFQALQQGDMVPLDAHVAMKVTTLNPARTLVWAAHNQSAELGLRFDLSMAFVLEPLAGEQTRLISRIRGHIRSGLVAWLYAYLFFEPVDFVMVRKQLLGIKQRVEQTVAGLAK